MLPRMFPFIKASMIFRSRWIAILWVLFICWMVKSNFSEIAATVPADKGANAEAATDATGHPISDEDVKRLKEEIDRM